MQQEKKKTQFQLQEVHIKFHVDKLHVA